MEAAFGEARSSVRTPAAKEAQQGSLYLWDEADLKTDGKLCGGSVLPVGVWHEDADGDGVPYESTKCRK